MRVVVLILCVCARAQIIFGMYTPEQQQPDMDLGRSIKPGRRNFTETDRAFGVPSIRTDVRAPKNKSVASTQVTKHDGGFLSLISVLSFCVRIIS